MERFFFILALITATLVAKPLTWPQTKKLSDFKAAKLDIAGHLPQLAIPKLQALMTSELSREALTNIRELLGEAQVRAGDSNGAIQTLTGNSTNSNQWKAYALIQLGKLNEAEQTLAEIKGANSASQRALILSALGQKKEALHLLSPILKQHGNASLQAISIHLDLDQLDEAQELIKQSENKGKNDPAIRFLRGRLLFAKGERIAAIGAFESIINDVDSRDLKLSSALYHASTIGLADSLALDKNQNAGVKSIIETIKKNPDSPRIDDLFSRLALWIEHVPINQLKEWTRLPPASPLAPMIRGNFNPPTVPSAHTAWALYLLGTKILSEESRAARIAFSRLFLNLPDNLLKLRLRSLVSLGLEAMKDERTNDALGYFKELQRQAADNEMRSVASSLVGMALFAIQDPKQAAAAFAEASELAKETDKSSFTRSASLNAALSRLQAGLDAGEVPEITTPIFSLGLERGLLLADQDNPQARQHLEAFLSEHSQNPRIEEAQLALGENYIFTTPLDPERSEELLSSLRFEPPEVHLEARRIIALFELNKGFIEANQFLARHPQHPAGASILFRQGLALTRNNETAEAFVRYEKLLENFPKSEFAEPARMLSAQAAFSVGNVAAEERAFQRYHELIEANGPLATDAALERARLRIDRGEFETTLQELTPLLTKKEISPANARRSLVLAAEAASNANQLKQAITFYDRLLSLKNLPIAWSNRVSYEKGRVLERLGKPLEALNSYNQVINRNLYPKNVSELEWKWYNRCALEGALPLLERLQNWEAAYAVALKVSKSGGPSSEKAGERAKRIQLERQLWDVE